MAMTTIDPIPKEAQVFACLQYKPFKNSVGKEKLLVTSNFSFSHSIFYLFKELSAISSDMKLSSANSFSSGGSHVAQW